MWAISHLRHGKSDGFEGLFSDNFINYLFYRVCFYLMDLSNCFSVQNGVKQGGVLSLLFAIYTDGLLHMLKETGVGCHMGAHFTGALAYADDLTLVSPSISGLTIMIDICEQYAKEYYINGNRSQLLCFTGRGCVSSYGDIYL